MFDDWLSIDNASTAAEQAVLAQALAVAVAANEAAHFIGMPEGDTALAQAAIYLATAPKSNAVYAAYNAAAADAHAQAAEPVPLHLRNAPTRLVQSLDYGKGYQYAHDDPEAVAAMECLPPSMAVRRCYRPTLRGFEKEIPRVRIRDDFALSILSEPGACSAELPLRPSRSDRCRQTASDGPRTPPARLLREQPTRTEQEPDGAN